LSVFDDLEMYDLWLNALSAEKRMECLAASYKCRLGPSIHVYDDHHNGRNADGSPHIERRPCGQVASELIRVRSRSHSERPE
jgi:hypothetical protein